MIEGGLNGERLSEVSRLAGVLADEVLRETVAGETSLAKLTALGKAALLLQDYDRPIPDRVVYVRSRALRGEDGEDGGTVPGATGAGQDGGMQEIRREPIREPMQEPARAIEDLEAPRRLFPRLIQSLRPPRGQDASR